MTDDDPPNHLPRPAALDRLLELTRPCGIPVVVYRAVTLRLNQELHDVTNQILLLDSEVDGRWNPLGLRTRYTSLDRQTAAAEAARITEAQSPGKEGRLTIVVSPLTVQIKSVIDLSDPDLLLSDFGISTNPDDQPTYVQRGPNDHPTPQQRIGAGVAHLGHPALLVPSVQRFPHPNLIIFTNQLGPEEYVDITVDVDEDNSD